MERVSRGRNVCVAVVSLLVACGGPSGPRPSEAVIPPVPQVDSSTGSTEPVTTEDANPGGGTEDANQEGGAEDANADAGDDGGPTVGLLDCAFLNATNCWQTAALTADGCLPEMGSIGTLSTDGTMCIYSSGTVVTFQSAIMVNGMSPLAPFTVATGGVACVTYAQPETQVSTLTTDAGVVELSIEDDGGVLGLTCPDGTMFAGPLAGLTDCPNSVPGYNSAAGGLVTEDGGIMEQLTLSLTGTGLRSDGELTVFSCQS